MYYNRTFFVLNTLLVIILYVYRNESEINTCNGVIEDEGRRWNTYYICKYCPRHQKFHEHRRKKKLGETSK